MVVTVLDNAEAVAGAVADRIQAAVAANPEVVLGLPAGRSPLPVYGELRRRVTRGELDLDAVTTFNLDEFLGVAAAHPGSFRRFMDEHFLRHLHLAEARAHFLDGMAADPEAECRRYEEAIRTAGGVDLQLLGIGTNGHIGFNEPGDALIAATHRARLLPSTREANAKLFGGDPARVPEFALTMGVGTILAARTIVLIAIGERKASCVAQAVHGPITTRVPASLLQLHRDVTVYLDPSAAAGLA